MKPPQILRLKEKHLERAERRKIEAVESKFLPAGAENGENSWPDFASEHLLRSKHLILVHGSSFESRHHRSAPPGPLHESVVCFSSLPFFVVGSVNGLICIAGTHRKVNTRDDIWILNPVTQLSIKLPPPASPTIDDHYVSFAFYWGSDSKESYYKVFKVVCECEPCDLVCDWHPRLISLDRPIVSNHVEVWDSRSPHTWTKIENVVFPRPFYHPGGMITSCAIVVEKIAFWIVADSSGLDLFLLSINMETHAVKQISLPELLIPIDFHIVKFIFGGSHDTFLFGAIWEGSFALFERLSFNSMLYNVWAIDESGASLIKKTTFLVDFGFRRFLGCIDGKLFVEQNQGLKVLFDMETRKGELSVADTFVVSAHDYVVTPASIEGFKPIRSFANCPCFTVFWPNLPAFASEDASGERAPPVIEPPSVVVPPASANVRSGVNPATSLNVSPAAAKGSVSSAPKMTYASLVANWTRVNSPKAARATRSSCRG